VHILALTAYASASLADPIGSSPLVAAVAWLQGTLLGTIATTIAVIAVAWVGMLMLAGRVHFRRGVTVIIGCFILFGASSIAAGIRSAATDGGTSVETAQLTPAPAPTFTPAPPVPYDPYAGASVPRR
jgi:type IV secretory pathway VirB2 component (pilin)